MIHNRRIVKPSQMSLVLIDEVHLLHEAGRGASLEAGTVCRIKMLAGLPEMAGVRGPDCHKDCCSAQLGTLACSRLQREANHPALTALSIID